MLSHTEQVEPENVRAEMTALPRQEELKALGANLPPELDDYLKKLVDTGIQRCGKSGLNVHYLLRVFSSGEYTDAELQTTLAALDTTHKGSTPHARICAWLLGVPLLKSSDKRSAAVALKALLHKAPSQLLMPAEKRLRSALAWSIGSAALLALLPYIALLLTAQLGTAITFVGSTLFFGLALFPILLVVLHHRELDGARELRFIAAHALGRLQAVEALDSLLAASLEQDTFLAEMALISLRVILPHLSTDHQGSVGVEATPNLCRLLNRHAPAYVNYSEAGRSLTTELLDALEKIGDPRAIPHIQQLASDWPSGPLSEKAARVLTVLDERKRRGIECATLLRGAAQPVANPAELLRATAATPESRPDQLLRPAD